jgi:hypothetical protein
VVPDGCFDNMGMVALYCKVPHASRYSMALTQAWAVVRDGGHEVQLPGRLPIK